MEPWTRFMTAPTPEYKAQVWDEFLTREELKELLDLAYRRFYFRPKFVARNLFQIRGRQDFVRKAKGRRAPPRRRVNVNPNVPP
jgi:hypothetical protein